MTGRVRGRYRIGVVHAALALAIPYAVLGLPARPARARSSVVAPSAWQALLACFLLALVAGGLGAARALVASTTHALAVGGDAHAAAAPGALAGRRRHGRHRACCSGPGC